ncbi:MAG: class I SAM-dependent methyltransferase [Elusimicrobiota bacterium]
MMTGNALRTACAVCAQENAGPLLTVNGFTLRRCQACDFMFTERQPSAAELESYYGREYFEGGNRPYGYHGYDGLQEQKSATFRLRLTTLTTQLPRKGRLLDVGCGTGIFVRCAIAQGWNAYGIDVSRYAVTAANEHSPGRFHACQIKDAPYGASTFDAIAALDCLEHSPDPIGMLGACARLLKPEGLLLIETPNASGLLFKLMGRHWPYLTPPEHLCYFGPRNLAKALSSCGMRVLKWRPSCKVMTLPYIKDGLCATNPRLAALLAPLTKIPALANALIKVPTGSFWALAVKNT